MPGSNQAFPRVGVSVLLREGERVLLILRAKAPYKNYWSLPGGRVEFGEPLRDAARRECAEETGLDAAIGDRVGVSEILEPDSGPSATEHFVIVTFAATREGGSLAAGDDAAEAAFFAADQWTNLPLTPQTRDLLERSR